MGLFNLLKKAVDVSTEVATTAIYAVGEEQKAASDLKHQKESAERNQEEKKNRYDQILENESHQFELRRENYMLSFAFAKVLSEGHYGERDFSFLNQLPAQYRAGTLYRERVQDVMDYYLEYACGGMMDQQVSATLAICSLSNLTYFSQLVPEINLLTKQADYFKTEGDAARSVISLSEDLGAQLTSIKGFAFDDMLPFIEGFGGGLEYGKKKEYVKCLKEWLYVDKTEEYISNLKKVILSLAMNEQSEQFDVEVYRAVKKMCLVSFGLSVVYDTPKGEALTLYPCIDVIIAEAIRLSRASSYDEYTEKLKNWLIYCGDRVDTDQLVLLQNVCAYLQAYELEKVVLEYVVQNNLPHTEAQSERLAFLRKQSSSAFGGALHSALQMEEDGSLLYDHRFLNWSADAIQRYFDQITLENKVQTLPMVIDEWKKEINLPKITWDIDQVKSLICKSLASNFGDDYDVSVIDAGAAVEGWIDTLPTIYIHATDKSVRNSEISFMVVGDQLTKSQIHMSIMVLLAADESAGSKNFLCKKVIAVKEKHNPRMETFINMIKNILIEQLEAWINSQQITNDIY